MRWFQRKRTFLLLFLSFLVLLFFSSKWLTLFYPIYYKDEIRQHAQDHGINPLLVAAIIKVESDYKPGSESHKGALGVMQIMPDTAKWIMEKAEFKNVPLTKVKNEVDENIKMGTWYLEFLSQKFDGNEIAIIAAYNAGPTNVMNWIKKGKWDGTLESSKNIPFGETRHYVQRVSHYYKQYCDIYKEL
jgi:soluble lytic murein transglycosylase